MNLILGDCLEELKKLPNNSVDSIVTDPPYELGFMGKKWDNTGIANNKSMWAECLRVLKPGGHLLAFSGTRTYHRMTCAIEDAGFEVRDMIEWVYGSGFPKSLNIGKVMDKYLKTGNASWNGTGDSSNGALGYSKLQHNQGYRPADYSNKHQNKEEITEDLAKKWEGFGTALKPAHEPICMARKPLSEKTIVKNVLKHGTGAIDIDGCRIPTSEVLVSNGFCSGLQKKCKEQGARPYVNGFAGEKFTPTINKTGGRFPANLIHDNSEEVRECFPDSNGSGKARKLSRSAKPEQVGWGMNKNEPDDVELLDAGSGNASRFFKSIIYQAKASKSERNKGCEGLETSKKFTAGNYSQSPTCKTCDLTLNGTNDHSECSGEVYYKEMESKNTKNNHPTVKPVALMEYLIKMVTRKGGVVLDPFMGSGSTGVACRNLGYDFIGIEREAEYIKIAEARIKEEE